MTAIREYVAEFDAQRDQLQHAVRNLTRELANQHAGPELAEVEEAYRMAAASLRTLAAVASRTATRQTLRLL